MMGLVRNRTVRGEEFFEVYSIVAREIENHNVRTRELLHAPSQNIFRCFPADLALLGQSGPRPVDTAIRVIKYKVKFRAHLPAQACRTSTEPAHKGSSGLHENRARNIAWGASKSFRKFS